MSLTVVSICDCGDYEPVPSVSKSRASIVVSCLRFPGWKTVCCIFRVLSIRELRDVSSKGVGVGQ